jgi:hypothetical protein
MSNFLTFKDLNALSLASKDLGSFANPARMLKVKEWESSSNEGENVWIEHYKQNYPRIINPASLYLKCLRYRHICADHFREIVLEDPRLTARQQLSLTTIDLQVQPSKLFYWFVVELLPRRPLKINFSLELLQKALRLPYGQEIIRKTTVSRQRVFLFLNKRGNIVISNDEGLLGVVTTDAHLWTTRLWNESFSVFLSVLCAARPELIITAFSSTCPFCGIDVSLPCSHTMRCMENYARWVSGGCLLNNVEILSK